MAEKELNSDDFIKHHLQNLTFGYCEGAGEWRFADGHINIKKDLVGSQKSISDQSK